jgi:alanyl-tRNA synthetase
MTDRLYYTDAYLTEFTGTVTAVDAATRRVYLDRSALYPTSGGQPHDLGRLGASAVTDVVDEEERVAHVVDDPRAFTVGASVTGAVDWTRRFDWMQQHTAQHLLSAICADDHGWPTTSVHFGDAHCTVELAAPAIDAATLVAIEERANALLVENRAVTVTFEDAAHATGLRKPSDRGGMLRIVTIEGIDRSACGGTHVRRTGEVGALLLRRTEKMKGGTRIEFLAGFRAVRGARDDHALLARAARALSAAPDELPALVESQLAALRDAERDRKRLGQELARHEAAALWRSVEPDASGVRRIRLAPLDGAAREAEPLAQALVALGGCVVIATGRTPPGVLFAASADSGVDASATLRAALTAHGGRGGGSPRVAQGSVPDAEALTHVLAVLGDG